MSMSRGTAAHYVIASVQCALLWLLLHNIAGQALLALYIYSLQACNS